MTDQDLEKGLENLADPGDPEEAIARGGGEGVLKRRQRRRFFSYFIPLASVIAAVAIAAPLTWYYAKKTPASNNTGEGGSNDPIAYMQGFSKFYYPYSIAHLANDTMAYGEIYYSWNSVDDEYLIFHLFLEVASAVEISDGVPSSTPLLYSASANSRLGFSGMSFSFIPSVKNLSGAMITLDRLTLDLTPFYNTITNSK
jgi:hypothetical protein